MTAFDGRPEAEMTLPLGQHAPGSLTFPEPVDALPAQWVMARERTSNANRDGKYLDCSPRVNGDPNGCV